MLGGAPRLGRGRAPRAFLTFDDAAHLFGAERGEVLGEPPHLSDARELASQRVEIDVLLPQGCALGLDRITEVSGGFCGAAAEAHQLALGVMWERTAGAAPMFVFRALTMATPADSVVAWQRAGAL